MENEEQEAQPMATYIVSAVLILVVLVGAWYLRSRSSSDTSNDLTTQTEPIATPTPGPITKLACDNQYYNQKIAFKEYYLSVEGGDISQAKNVSCEFTAKVKDKIVGKATAEGPLSDAPERGGSTFRCTSKALALEPNVLTTIDVTLTDDLKASSTCSADFTFPSP